MKKDNKIEPKLVENFQTNKISNDNLLIVKEEFQTNNISNDNLLLMKEESTEDLGP
jgi:hypothetical protein